MTQEVQVHKPKVYKCFTCGQEVTFKPKEFEKNAKGKSVPKRFNLDGTAHICKQEDKQKHQSSDEYKQRSYSWSSQRRKRFLAWWHGYGKYRYKYGYRESYDKYNRREYEDRYNENKRKRDEYKQRYYNASLGITEALKRLELILEELMKLDKLERFRAIKQAYRKMCLKYHPDRNKEQDASKKFIEATEAYELLETKYEDLGAWTN